MSKRVGPPSSSRSLLILTCLLAALACQDGSSKSLRASQPLLGPRLPAPPLMSLSAAVQGLTNGATLVLNVNGVRSALATTDGVYVLLRAQPQGTSYVVTLPYQPNGHVCSLVHGAGRLVPGAFPVAVQCSLAMQLGNDLEATETLGQPSSSSAQVLSPPSQDSLVQPWGKTYTDEIGVVYAADRGNNRVLGYFPAGELINKSANFVLGQDDLFSGAAPGLSADSFNQPCSVQGKDDTLVVTDCNNHRVLIYESMPRGQVAADVVVGQADFTSAATGCSSYQLNAPTSAVFIGDQLAVADSDNGRVLIYNSVPTVNGAAADIVLGQATMSTCQANRGGVASAMTLYAPQDAWSDGNRLFVTDLGNHRVLGWHYVPLYSGETADIVLGQPDMSTTASATVAADTLTSPMYIVGDGQTLFVSDMSANRVVAFHPVPARSGQSTSYALGQARLDASLCNEGLAGPTSDSLCGPTGLSYIGGSLAITDSLNNRLQVYNSDPNAASDAIGYFLVTISPAAGPANSNTIAAGALAQVVITAMNVDGTQDANYLGTVALNASDANATFSGTPSFSAANAGSLTLHAVFLTAGSQQVGVVDTRQAKQAGDGNVLVLPANANHLLVTGYPNPATAGAAANFTVAVYDAYNNVATNYMGVVAITSNDAAATLPAPIQFATVNAGIASASLTFAQVGTNRITATDSNDALVTGSEPNILTTSNAGQATTFTFSGYINPIAAGQQGNVTITARDANGAVALGYLGTIQLTSTDPNASLAGNVVFNQASQGVVQVPWAFATAGNQTVTATDTHGASIAGTSGSIVVQGGNAVALLAYNYPSPITAGQSANITLRAIDAYGNTAIHYLGKVALALSDPYAVASPNYQFLASNNGNARVPVTFETVGTWQVTAQDQNVPSLQGQQNQIVVQPGPVAFFLIGNIASPQKAGTNQNIFVTPRDAYDNLATSYNGSVTFTSTDPNASLPSTLLFTNGLQNTSPAFSFHTSGTWSVTANDTVTPSLSGIQSSVVVTPGAAAQLLVSGFPSPVTAGQLGNVTLRPYDIYGNLVTTYTGTVGITSSDAQAVLPANIRFGMANLGVAHAQVTLGTSGLQTINANDTNTLTIAGNQHAIQVNPNAAVRLQVSTAPSIVNAGQSGNVTVRAFDAYGNVATTYTGTAHFTSSDTNAVLPANTTFAAGDLGVKTVAVTMKTVGTQLINVNDTVTASIAGAQNISVVASGSASYFVVKNYPTSVIAGSNANVTVSAYDTYGNLATGYTGTVHLTSTDPNALPQSDLTFTTGFAGMANMTMMLKTAGTQAINANDVSTPAIAGREGNILVSPNTAITLKVSGFSYLSAAGAAGNFTVVALDAYGNVATGYTGQVAITTSDPAASALGNYTFTSGDAGTRSFGTTFFTAGNQNLYAVDTATASIAGSERGIMIVSASVNHFSVTNFSTPIIAGTQGNVTVSARDIYNNIVYGYTGTVHLSSSDANAQLPADLAYVLANRGVAQMPVTLKTAGTRSINANDQATPSISGQQNAIIVNAATATHFKVTNFPVSATAGQQGNVHVAAYDDYNNLATGYSGTVHLSSTDPCAQLPADQVYSGAAADLPVTLTSTGTQAINANDTAHAAISGNQNFIVVSPNVATHLVARTFPTPTTAGTQGNVTIVAYDMYNNIATGYTGTVHVASSDANAVKPSDYTFTTLAAGAAQLPVTLLTTGNQNIKITDTSNALLTSTQPNITVKSNTATHYAVSGYPNPATAGQQGNVTFAVLDNYNNIVTSYTGTLHISSTDIAAIVPYDLAFRATDAGVLALPVTLTTSGNQKIVGTDYDVPSITGSQNAIVVNPNVATHIGLGGYPSSQVAGTQGNVTVTILDAYANVVPSFVGTVNLTSDDPLATYPSSVSYTAGNAGVSTVSLTFASNGNHVLNANGAANPNLAGALPVVVVSPNSVTHFVVQNYPSLVSAGQQANVTILAVDNFNNVVPSYTGTVHLSSTDANASLPANYTFLAANQGNVSLPVTLKTSGTRVISANDTTMSAISGFQNNIVVSPNVATRFALAGVPGASTAGNTNTLTVTAFDNYNNVATNFADVVAISSSDPNAALGAASTLTAGVGTFLVRFVTAGTQWLNANDTSNPNLAAQQSGIVVSPAAAVAFLTTGFSVSPTACQTGNITITAVDNYNNVVPSYTGTVTLTTSDAAAALPAAASFTAANAGVRPLAVTLKTPGAQTITATDGTGLTGTDSNIMVMLGSPNSIKITAPNVVRPTLNFGAVVAIMDNCNNLATSYTGTVNLTSGDSNGTPSSTAVPVVFAAGDAGVKSVTGLRFKTIAAARALNANDATWPSLISGHTTVTVAASPFYADWDYSSATQSSYTYNASKIDFTSSYAELTPINTQAGDTNSTAFAAGTAVNTRWDTGVSALVQGNSNPNIPVVLYAGGEYYDPMFVSGNVIVASSGTYTNANGTGVPTIGTSGSYYSESPYSGSFAYVMQGNQTVNSGSSTLFMKLIDLSTKNFVVDANSQLVYWFFPTGANTSSITAGNSNYMVLYLQFSDGTRTSSGSVMDVSGHALTPAGQGANVVSNAWNRVVVKLGSQGLAGKTIDHIGMYWNRSGFTGGFMGFVDDILLTGVTNYAQTNSAELAADWTPQYNNIVAYHKFEGVGSIADGTVFPATIGGNLTAHNSDGNGMTFVAGRIKQGVFLDGKDDYFTIAANQLPGTQTLTVAGWANTVIATSVANYCPRFWGLGTNPGYHIDLLTYCGYPSAVGVYEMKTNGAGVSTTGPQGIQGTWMHWVTTYDGSTAVVYVNGQAVASNVLNSNALALEGNVNLIGVSPVFDFWLRGFVDDFAVWNTALSANDVRVIYERQSAAYTGSLTSRVLASPFAASGTASMAWNTTYPAYKPLPSDAVSERSGDYVSNGNTLLSGLEYLWHLDESVLGGVYGGDFLDDTGHGSTAFVSGNGSAGGSTQTLGTPGRFNAAVTLNGNTLGTTDYIAAPTRFTASVWFKTSNGYGALLNFGNAQTGAPGSWDRQLYITPAGAVAGGAYDGAVHVATSKTTGYNDNRWHHALMTQDGSTVNVYVDGQLQGSASYSGAYMLNGWWRIGVNTVSTGDWVGGTTTNYAGSLDEIAIWNRALSASEALQVFRRGGTRFKYRVRTCTNATCSDNQSWRGPDGNATTYFSETSNVSGTNTQNAWSPNLAVSAFANLGINANQAYMQYQGIWESDDTQWGCTYNGISAPCSAENTNVIFNRVNYDTSSPAIGNANTISYYGVMGLTSVLGGTGCAAGVTYTLSPDNATYYYYTGSAWATSNGTVAQTSTAAQLTPATLATYSSNYGMGQTYFKAYLTSSGSSPCSLQSVALNGNQ